MITLSDARTVNLINAAVDSFIPEVHGRGPVRKNPEELLRFDDQGATARAGAGQP